MSDRRASTALFLAAVEEVRAVTFRDDLVVHEIEAPTGLAPESYALAAQVRPHAEGESVYGTGRLVLLHDPEEPESWAAPWRIIAFAQAPLEPEIGMDPLLADVTWAWLTDALASHGAVYSAASGTATKTLSRGFGALASHGDGAQIELRASWSPEPGFSSHIQAWAELIGMLAGLPPGSEGVAVFGARKDLRG